MTLLDRAMTLLRHEYAAHGKASTFETLMVFLGSNDSNSTLSYEEAANALGVGMGAVRTLIHRLRKQYTCLLREEVARTVSEPTDVPFVSLAYRSVNNPCHRIPRFSRESVSILITRELGMSPQELLEKTLSFGVV
jgi:hypothetical protein